MSVHPVARHLAALLCAVLVLAGVERTVAAPEGTLTIGMHFTPVPRWLDPAEGESTITRYRGGAAKVLKDSVQEIQTPAPYEDLKLRRP